MKSTKVLSLFLAVMILLSSLPFAGVTALAANAYPSISVDETKTVNISKGGDCAYFVFVPEESEMYAFYSSGDVDTYGYLYDEDMNELASNDDGGENLNFCVSYYLEAGKTYYFACKMLSSNQQVYLVLL